MDRLPPPLATTERDPPAINRDWLAADAAAILAKDAAREQTYPELEDLYSPQAIKYYNLINLGFMTSAELFASQHLKIALEVLLPAKSIEKLI